MKSVFSKMLVSCIVILFITVTVTSTFLLRMTMDYIVDREEAEALSSAEELGGLLRYRSPETAQLFNRIIVSYAEENDATVFVCNTEGMVLISSGSVSGSMQEYVPVGYQLSEKQYKEIMEGNIINEHGNFDGYFSGNVVTVGVPLNIDGYLQGGVFVCRTIPVPSQLMGDIMNYFVVCVAVLLVIASVIIYITAKRITAPIAKIKKSVRAFAVGDFTQRAELYGEGEIEELAVEFNKMAESLEDLESNRRAFLADISHELRTPMTTISGFVDGMLDGTIPEDKWDRYLSIVLEESRRLTRLVNDILLAEKYNRSEVSINKESFDINEIIRVVLLSLESRISEKNIDVTAEFEYESVSVFADRDSITRVITNLLDNAVKFTNVQGSIKITTENRGGRCRVAVFNSGSFIHPDDRNKIFDRFFKTDRSRSMDKNGVGLGLHIVKSILSQHQSRINVTSNDDGTTFSFSIDLAK